MGAPYGPALSGQGLAPGLVAVHVPADRWSHPELKELGRRRADDTFDLTDLRTHLVGAERIDDREFTVHRLDEQAITDLRRRAREWAGYRRCDSRSPRRPTTSDTDSCGHMPPFA